MVKSFLHLLLLTAYSSTYPIRKKSVNGIMAIIVLGMQPVIDPIDSRFDRRRFDARLNPFYLRILRVFRLYF